MRRVLALTLVTFGLLASPAYADKVVNAAGDAGTGGCTASECTLREAVVDSTGPTDPVIVPGGTYNLTQGPLQLVGRTIIGAGARSTIIDAGGTNKVLYVSGATNQVSGVTLRNGGGVVPNTSVTASGGAVLVQSSFAPTGLTMTNVAVTGSHADGDGGGIASLSSTLTLIDSTVSGNSAISSGQAFGGGIAAEGAGTTTLRNTTVSSNMASADAPAPGGGIYLEGGNGTARLVTDGVTIAGNKSPRASGLFMASNSDTGSLTRTIIAGNLLLTGAPGPDCDLDSGLVTSALSIADDATCNFAGSPQNPQLGPLTNNGGPTDTHALAITSPAIDAGGACTPADQRGIPRQGACDIGAFEYFRPQLTVIKHVVNNDRGEQAAGDFTVHVRAGASDIAGSPQPGTEGGRTYTLVPGTYTVSEDRDKTYAVSFSGSCSATGAITLGEGQAATCTITNNDKPPGKKFNVQPERGTVKVKPRGKKHFHLLKAGEQLPRGSIVDTRKGRIGLIAAADSKGHEKAADFYDGLFKLTQTKGKRPITVLTLVEKLTGCKAKGKASIAKKKKKVKKRRLWGNGKGRFQTKGKHSAATVVGTKWLVEDRCASTLTKVARGKVKVRDFVKHKTVRVKKGHRYIARAK